MKFDFFTFGGSVFWEDVFFYKKWRIQRNCYTKRYRLLDSWDIRRASGTFEDCQKAFIRYIDCYEITKQRGDMIVLLHGYADSKNIFKPLWRRFMRTKANVAALNYPSLVRNAQGVAHQILFFLNHIESINKVSFVTKGCGNLVLRQMFNLPLELQTFRQNMRIGNIVEINPVERRNLLCELIVRVKFFRFLFGPFLNDFTESGLKNLPSLPSECNVLKIFSPSITHRIFNKLLNLLPFYAKEDVESLPNDIFIKGTYFTPLKNEQVLDFTIKLINNGKI
jgi:hypothetical protein